MPMRWEILNPKGPKDWDGLVMSPMWWPNHTSIFAIGGLSSDRGTIVRSEDKGASWSIVDFDAVKPKGSFKSFGKMPGLRQLSHGVGNERLLACGEYGTVLGSSDGGKTWKQAKPPIDGCLFGIIERKKRIWVSGDEGIWHRPFGNGEWVQADSTPGLARMYQIGFNDAYLVVGDNGTLLLIDEDDSVRQIEIPGVKDDLYSCAWIRPEQRILVGNYGLLLRWDGGPEFTKVPTGTNEALMSVIYIGRGRYVAVGHRQTVLVSEDEGVTWRKEPGPKDSGNLWGTTLDTVSSFVVSGDDGLIARGHFT